MPTTRSEPEISFLGGDDGALPHLTCGLLSRFGLCNWFSNPLILQIFLRATVPRTTAKVGWQNIKHQEVKKLAPTLTAAKRIVKFRDRTSNYAKSKQAKGQNLSKGGGEKKDVMKSSKRPNKGSEEIKKKD
ncbi:hypothetical protein MRB53_010456 [Persea americana]|uniref:Uncharacterized protein n=1 Tax=Persea americana TaxID=3435 RepID=A0ACC2LRW1_PERAE|nr:hypothetical protein MRB53_010456 [Persea americana]